MEIESQSVPAKGEGFGSAYFLRGEGIKIGYAVLVKDRLLHCQRGRGKRERY